MLALPKNLTYDGSAAEYFAPSDWLHLDDVVSRFAHCLEFLLCLSPGVTDSVFTKQRSDNLRVAERLAAVHLF